MTLIRPEILHKVSQRISHFQRKLSVLHRCLRRMMKLQTPTLSSFISFLPYSQPTCAICLEDYESGVSEIRELPCGHIFHPACIDMFLANHSSLCPLCKKSAFPVGYCPAKITNAMVLRERNLRRIRSRVNLDAEAEVVETSGPRGRLQGFGASMKKTLRNRPRNPSPLPLRPQPVFMTSAVTELPQPHSSFGSSRSRDEFVEQRVRDLAARQTPIRDPDVIQERRLPQWRKTLAKAFPGF